jgi:hypothetical protein
MVERKDAWKVVPKAEKKVVYWEDKLVDHSAAGWADWTEDLTVACLAVR